MNLKEMFLQNGYPLYFFERVLRNFVTNKMSPPPRIRSPSDSSDDIEKFYILRIPYLGRVSVQFRRKLTKLVKDSLGMKLRCVFHSCRVRNFFSLRCKSSHFLSSNVVYRFTCRRDASISYVGETRRHLGIRASEHLNIENPNLSAVASHIVTCVDCRDQLSEGLLDHNSFEIIKRGRTKSDIQKLEAMLIKELNPSLNLQVNLFPYTLRIFN